MNQRNSIFGIILLGLLGGLFAVVSILLGEGNEMASFYQYLLMAFFVAGFLIPRSTFIFWLALCGYTDLLKRFMVVTGRVSFMDLYYVLGIPPVMVVAMTLSVLVGSFSGRFVLKRMHWTMLAISGVIMAAVAAVAAAKTGGALKSIGPAVANDGLYVVLIFLVPALFQTTDEVLRLLKLLLWFYLPVACYGIFQQIYGYQEFELIYLRSGLSIEIKQLVANELRAFSTLNSPTALATVCAALCTVSLVLAFLPRNADGRRALGWVPALLMAAIYTGGMIASTGRAAVVVILFGLMGWLCFRSLKLTVAAYILGIAGFVTLVLSAEQLLAKMNVYQDQMSTIAGEGQFARQMTRVGTYSDRLKGFSNLAQNPEVWNLFGHDEVADDDHALASHDLLTNTLVNHGSLLVMLAGTFLAICVASAHRFVLRIHDSLRRNAASALLALALSIIVLSLLSGNVLVIFPINVFACLFCGMLLVIFQHDKLTTSECEEPAPEIVSPPQETPAIQLRVAHRFTRTGQSSC